MSLAGESLVQARWLAPFSTALLKLKKHQDHLRGLLDAIAQALPPGRNGDELPGLVAEARRLADHCRQVLGERTGEFDDHASRAEDLNTRLYREVISSRMRPFADGAHGFPRLVRDLARTLGRQARLEIDGADTPVDRDILEKLEAPLNHLLRNAVDHAIETPELRRAAGKPEAGLIRVEARHRAGMLAITVSDDGRGINVEAVRRKVVERGLATAAMAQSLSEPELLEFLFLPGFSTAAAVTEVSGRGVGLDVVLTAARAVGGSARVTTHLGRGTTFHLQLPITLSVLRAVLVEIAGEVYAFPHNRIERILRVPRAEVRSLENRQYLILDGLNVGLVLAAQVLDLPAAPPTTEDVCVVLLGDGTGLYGLIVEAFRGEQDLVVRPLDARLGKVPNLSAAAILDDGAPVLIVDTEDLIRSTDRFIQERTLRRYEPAAKAERPRKRVLVVDDSITVREVERQLLRHRGYEVTLAVDGQEGWNAVRAEPFDLVVSDVDMPRMNGFELVRALRGDAALRSLPVIIVSYKDREEDRLKGLDAGANYYLTKSSFHDETFLRAVADLIGEA
jgi:two-component system sensor histidine kinase and response regulator WspE